MAKVKMSKKKKTMLIIGICTLFVGIIVIMLMRNYKRARSAEDALNSAGVQESIAFVNEWNSANVEKKKEMLNASMTEAQAKTYAENFWALMKGATNKSEKKQISEMILAVKTGADWSRIAEAYRKVGLGRGGRGLVEQINYDLTPKKKYKEAYNHMTWLLDDGINS